MAEKVYVMVIKADLACCRCYKNIRKVLCQTPGIQSQEFEVKQNTVKVTGSFNPLKLACKLRCKASECISGIEITEFKEKPKAETKPEKKPETKPETKPDPKPPPPPPPVQVQVEIQAQLPVGICCRPCSMGYGIHYCEKRRARDCCRRCDEGYEGHYCEKRRARDCCRRCDEGYEGHYCENEGGNCNIM